MTFLPDLRRRWCVMLHFKSSLFDDWEIIVLDWPRCHSNVIYLTRVLLNISQVGTPSESGGGDEGDDGDAVPASSAPIGSVPASNGAPGTLPAPGPAPGMPCSAGAGTPRPEGQWQSSAAKPRRAVRSSVAGIRSAGSSHRANTVPLQASLFCAT